MRGVCARSRRTKSRAGALHADGDGVVVSVHAIEARPENAKVAAARITAKGRPKRSVPAPEHVAIRDRVLIERIKPFDRKPGLAGVGFTYDDPDRSLPAERAGSVRVLHLTARAEWLSDRGQRRRACKRLRFG